MICEQLRQFLATRTNEEARACLRKLQLRELPPWKPGVRRTESAEFERENLCAFLSGKTSAMPADEGTIYVNAVYFYVIDFYEGILRHSNGMEGHPDELRAVIELTLDQVRDGETFETIGVKRGAVSAIIRFRDGLADDERESLQFLDVLRAELRDKIERKHDPFYFGQDTGHMDYDSLLYDGTTYKNRFRKALGLARVWYRRRLLVTHWRLRLVAQYNSTSDDGAASFASTITHSAPTPAPAPVSSSLPLVAHTGTVTGNTATTHVPPVSLVTFTSLLTCCKHFQAAAVKRKAEAMSSDDN